MKDIKLDFDRTRRIGFDEAILCAGKSVDQLNRILQLALDSSESLLLTRMSQRQYEELATEFQQAIDFDAVSQTAFFGVVCEPSAPSKVAIVSAGSSDVPVATEALRTLRYYGRGAELFLDVGVAGIWRVLDAVDKLKEYPAVIVVAGMDGSLPSVVGGLIGSLVIAVPTSTGYGAANGGMAALNSALASCAPGLVVVNIDNGYGAAIAAVRSLQ